MDNAQIPWRNSYDPVNQMYSITLPDRVITISKEDIERAIKECNDFWHSQLVDIRDVEIGDHASFDFRLEDPNQVRAYPLFNYMWYSEPVTPKKKRKKREEPPEPPDIGDGILDACLR